VLGGGGKDPLGMIGSWKAVAGSEMVRLRCVKGALTKETGKTEGAEVALWEGDRGNDDIVGSSSAEWLRWARSRIGGGGAAANRAALVAM